MIQEIFRLAVGCALLAGAATYCLADENGSPPPLNTATNPALEKFNAAITFYAGFDAGATADLSVGNGAPSDAKTVIETQKGIFGTAFLSGEQGLAYSAQNNIDLSKPGALAIWVSAYQWKRDLPDVPYLFFVKILSQGRQVMLARMGNAVNKETVYAYGKAGESSKTVSGGHSQHWQDADWHLLAVNWKNGALEFSLDGGVLHHETLPTFEKAEGKPGQIFVGNNGEANQRYLLDELMILNRPLAADEIAWLWQQK